MAAMAVHTEQPQPHTAACSGWICVVKKIPNVGAKEHIFQQNNIYTFKMVYFNLKVEYWTAVMWFPVKKTKTSSFIH